MKKTLFVLPVLAASLSLSAAKAGTKDCQNLSTPKGTISGALAKDGKTCVYKGIPYATPPEGELRFFPPKEHPGFKTPFKAEKFGNECPNYPIAFPPKRTWQGKEDCLFLNIWHKADEGQKKPVMFWIHGGGFITGSGSTGLYDGSLMADMGDVVVVTINYRLGLLGFLTHPEVTKATGNAGNMGLLDQVQALKWVKENIAAFGGDPNNVTIFGESAGGMSVVSLLIANGTKGLFNKAIVQSGPMTLLAASKQTAEKEGTGAAAKLGCGDKAKVFDCLSKVSVDDIMKKVAPSLGLGSKPTEVEKFAFAPIVDGAFIPEHPYKMLKTGKAHKGVAVMTGVTAQEMSLFLLGRTVNTWEDFDKLVTGYAPLIKDFLKVDIDLEAYVKIFPRTGKAYDTLVEMTTDMAFHCPGWEQAALLKDGRGGPFVYMHSKPPADTGLFGKLGAFHGSELPFVFGVFSFMGFKFETPANRELSNKYIQLWTSFAHTGVPKAEGAPDWPAYDPAQPWMMNLDTKVELRPVPKKASCDFIRQTMDKNYMGG